MKPTAIPPRQNRFARAAAVHRHARRADVDQVSGRRSTRRTFARLSAFDVSCPNCGTVDSVSAIRPWWKKKAKNFDAWRSRWTCRVCRRTFAVGIAFWPVTKAGNRPFEARPLDTIPTVPELLGLKMAVTRGWGDPVNLSCSCQEGQASPDCPLHAADSP